MLCLQTCAYMCKRPFLHHKGVLHAYAQHLPPRRANAVHACGCTCGMNVVTISTASATRCIIAAFGALLPGSLPAQCVFLPHPRLHAQLARVQQTTLMHASGRLGVVTVLHTYGRPLRRQARGGWAGPGLGVHWAPSSLWVPPAPCKPSSLCLKGLQMLHNSSIPSKHGLQELISLYKASVDVVCQYVLFGIVMCRPVATDSGANWASEPNRVSHAHKPRCWNTVHSMWVSGGFFFPNPSKYRVGQRLNQSLHEGPCLVAVSAGGVAVAAAAAVYTGATALRCSHACGGKGGRERVDTELTVCVWGARRGGQGRGRAPSVFLCSLIPAAVPLSGRGRVRLIAAHGMLTRGCTAGGCTPQRHAPRAAVPTARR
mgnify:CR=1 FL=1